MADYKLYDMNNHSVLIDPHTQEDKTFEDVKAAHRYIVNQNLQSTSPVNALIIKDSIPKDVRYSIEKTLGKIEYSDERIEDHGHVAVVKDHKGHYNSLQIDKSNEGFHINVKAGFPDHEQAYNHAFGQYTNEIEKHMKKNTIEKTAGQELSR